jgi:mono/diheme cytochrome c family protein
MAETAIRIGTTVNDVSKPQTREMRSVRRSIGAAIAIAFVATLVTVASPAFAQTTDEGVEIYESSCARCHQSDGLGTPGKYPPLTGNPDAADHGYVVGVVTDGLEGKVIMGVSYDSEMTSFANRLSPDEIDAVAGYVVELSGGGVTPSPTTTVPGVASGSAGESLFTGSTRLLNGGTACIACHSAGDYNRLGGPGLAIDLNGIVQDFGRAGFVAAITDPLVDPMIAVFGDHPITDQEAIDLAAYLETIDPDEVSATSVDLLMTVGLVGFVVLILITAGFIRGPQDPYREKLRSSR